MTIVIRKAIREDRSALDQLLSKITVFDAEDRAIAIELLDIYLKDPVQEDYQFSVAFDHDSQMIGYLCYGPTPLTEGTYDLYWIAVDPQYAGQGVGTLLMRQLESILKANHGRLIVIETSSSQQYALTRQFYLKNGYVLAETIKDFYRPGEDRVTFVKYF